METQFTPGLGFLGGAEVFVFIAAMVAGMLAQRRFGARALRKAGRAVALRPGARTAWRSRAGSSARGLH